VTTPTLFQLQNVDVSFYLKKSLVYALQDITLQGYTGKTLGVVGESGCGKSTLAKALLGLIPIKSGTIFFNGKNVHTQPRKDFKTLQRNMQMVFQDPDASLNPRMSVYNHLKEALLAHESHSAEFLEEKILELLEMVQLPKEFCQKYPHQLSGGQKQRVSIARALSIMPKLIVCDEPLASLDVSVSAQIIELLKSLQHEKKLSYLFITHDLASLGYLAHHIAVLYLGMCVEYAPTEVLFNNPKHPYTQALLSSALVPDPQKAKERSRIVVTGEIPSPITPPKGCVFHTRCPFATDECRKTRPKPLILDDDHFVACHLYTNKSSCIPS